ncbi:MAG: cysteine desulfurase family protein [Sphingobacterium sp.]
MEFCYFDNNATTQLDENVLEAMLPYLRESYGNASSVQHQLGRQASHGVEQARQQVAALLNVQAKEILFTSGATESISMVIRGIALSYRSKGRHIITCQTEHKAVLTACQTVEKNEDVQVTYLAVNHQGSIDLQELENAIRPETILVSIMAANNETGVLHPIDEIAAICQKRDVLFFCDATQWVGKIPLDLARTPIDLLCLSAHKIHGPKGIGALFIRRRRKPIQIPALIQGGQQEYGLRGGTYPVHQIVGLGAAAALAHDRLHSATLRDYFEKRIETEVQDITIHSQNVPRLPNTTNIQFKHVRANDLMTKLPDIAISTGSACVSGSRDPSHVLTAMGIGEQEALSTLRFSFSESTSKKEIDQAIPRIKHAVDRIRVQSPIWQMYKEGLI